MAEVIEEIMRMIEEGKQPEKKLEKTWYCVVSSYYDDGHVTANIVGSEKASERPRNTYTESREKDVYVDWFGSIQEAKDYIKDCLNA